MRDEETEGARQRDRVKDREIGRQRECERERQRDRGRGVDRHTKGLQVEEEVNEEQSGW